MVKPQLTLVGRHSPVKLQLITCLMLKMADETDLLLFTDFLVTIVVNTRLVLPKINAFKQYYITYASRNLFTSHGSCDIAVTWN